MTSQLQELNQWVSNMAKLTNAKNIHWCDGSDAEDKKLTELMLKDQTLIALNKETHPNCFLHRSDPNDVARTEHLTFVCTKKESDAGPNNNWMNPEEAKEKANGLFKNCMSERTMYVIPYCMGPLKSSFSRYGVEITDSPYVVKNMKLMTRMGSCALELIEKSGVYVKGLHSTGDLSIEKRIILHFPEDLSIMSFSSGYGGNALIGKKCHALRIASYQAQKEGWLAEHMLILGLESPEGEVKYIAAAFPSACGKTNLAMLIPPETYKGWKVWTVGDDIAWMHPGEDGQLYAINPEAGFFGVAPGTSLKTNPNALKMLNEDTVFTNVAVTSKNEPWWEGKDKQEATVDWKGNPYTKENPAAHPNSRFTVSSKRCSSYSNEAENPNGVPISAIIFGGRRPSLIPLVYESKSWTHGVLVGAALSSQTTAAATGATGILRHDPMAMKPFCGTHFGDYWNHWLSLEEKSSKLPKIFHVNWFRTDDQGKFIWPGFGENIRVLDWILKRSQDQVDAVETPIGFVPNISDLNLDNLEITKQQVENLCDMTPDGWDEELDRISTYLHQFDDRLPQQMMGLLQKMKTEISK